MDNKEKIEDTIQTLIRAKKEKEKLEKMIIDLEARLYIIAEEQQDSHFSVKTDDEEISANVVQNERLVFDQDELKKELGVALWRQVMTEKLDQKKLDRAIEKGIVDPAAASKHFQLKKSRAYVRITKKPLTPPQDL